MSDSYDVIVIGAGPGGYVAAIRAAQLGMSVACVEKRDTLGGTCLNVGCIPSKALLQSSEKFAEAKGALAVHGIAVGSVAFDLAKMMARKDKVVAENTRGVEFLFRKNKVARVKGAAKFLAPDRIEVDGQTLTAKRGIVIATGSDIIPLAGVEIDEKTVLSSTGALSLDAVPKRLVVVGAGYIGLELGSVWRRLGAQVTVVEFLDRVAPGMDMELGAALQRTLAKQGFEFRLSTRVVEAKRSNGGVTLALEPSTGGARETLPADAVLVSIGRRPYTEGLGLETVGVLRDNRGRIKVDTPLRHQRPRHLRDRRRDRGADARAQGVRRGRGLGRDHRRRAAAARLRCDSRGDLHLARSRLGRQDRGGAEGSRHRLSHR